MYKIVRVLYTTLYLVYKSVRIYRLLRLIKYLNMDFSRIINILFRELKILYIFSLIKTLLLFINGQKAIVSS